MLRTIPGMVVLAAVAAAEPVGTVCPHRFAVDVDTVTLEFPFCGSPSLSTYDPQITRLVLVIHGSARNATYNHDNLRQLAETLGQSAETLVIAPQFLEEEDLDPHGLPSSTLFWWGGWRHGNLSMDTVDHPRPARISSFAVLDQLLMAVFGSGNFPNLRRIVISGHSAGGQYVNRYAAGNLGTLTLPSDVTVRYVSANPATYVYFDDRRRVPGELDLFAPLTGEALAACPTYNDYKWGLDNLNVYMSIVGVATIRAQYGQREVVHLVGELDLDPDPVFHCEAEWQGAQHVERAVIYWNYLQEYYGPTLLTRHRIGVVPGVGHDSYAVFTSTLGMACLFDHTSDPDLDGDGQVDWNDWLLFLPGFAQMRPGPGDFDGNEVVDLADFATLMTAFGEGSER